MANEELSKVAIDAADNDMQGRQIMEASNEDRMLYSQIFRRGFKAGANWQHEKDEKQLQDHEIYKKGKEAGMRYMRQQMMKNVVEARVSFGQPVLLTRPIPTSLAKDGDKVKLIIVKDD